MHAGCLGKNTRELFLRKGRGERYIRRAIGAETSKCQALNHPGKLFIILSFLSGPQSWMVDCYWLEIVGAYDVNLVARVIKGKSSPQIMGLILRALTKL